MQRGQEVDDRMVSTPCLIDDMRVMTMRWIDADEMEKNVEDMIAYDLDGALKENVEKMWRVFKKLLAATPSVTDNDIVRKALDIVWGREN